MAKRTNSSDKFSTSWWPGCPPIRNDSDDSTPPHPPRGIGQNTFKFNLDRDSDDDDPDLAKQPPPTIELTSNFCSGNMKLAELEDDDASSPAFNLYTAVDCEGESPACLTTYRTWFYFAVRGATAGQTLTFKMMNMNKQTGLFGHDHRPSVCCMPSAPKWVRMSTSVTSYKMVDGNLELKFKYDVRHDNDELRFSFCFPMSYWEVQKRCEYLEQWFVPRGARLLSTPAAFAPVSSSSTTSTTTSGKKKSPRSNKSIPGEPDNDIYYHRELMTRSLDGRRMDLITITSTHGMDPNIRETETIPGLFKEHTPGNSEAGCGMGGSGLRSHHFSNRPIIYVSSRGKIIILKPTLQGGV